MLIICFCDCHCAPPALQQLLYTTTTTTNTTIITARTSPISVLPERDRKRGKCVPLYRNGGKRSEALSVIHVYLKLTAVRFLFRDLLRIHHTRTRTSHAFATTNMLMFSMFCPSTNPHGHEPPATLPELCRILCKYVTWSLSFCLSLALRHSSPEQNETILTNHRTTFAVFVHKHTGGHLPLSVGMKMNMIRCLCLRVFGFCN